MSCYFATALWRGILAQLAHPARVVLLVLIMLILLAGTAPAPAPACTEATARYVRRADVVRTATSNGARIAVPAGYAVAWSCESQAAADAELALQMARVR